MTPTPSSSSILIAGCGDIGTRLGILLSAQGHTVYGLRRSPSRSPSPITFIQADLTNPETLRSLPQTIDRWVYLATPDTRDEAGYRAAYVDGLQHLCEAIHRKTPNCQRGIFVSSTSVYGDCNGAWVDETTPANPSSFSGKILLEAEALLNDVSYPHTALRFGGIYGPKRRRLLDSVSRGEATIADTALYTNRIHVDDAVGVLAHLLFVEPLHPLYLGVDHDPADERDVFTFIAHALSLPEPRHRAPGERGLLSERRASHKRCSNRKVLESGYVFTYPSYREGYLAMISDMTQGMGVF